MLAWLSVWSEEQMICIRSNWCHCHPIISCFIKIQTGLTFLVLAYLHYPGKEDVKRVSAWPSFQLPQVGPPKRKPHGISGATFCQPNAFLLAKSTTSKQWREQEAVASKETSHGTVSLIQQLTAPSSRLSHATTCDTAKLQLDRHPPT